MNPDIHADTCCGCECSTTSTCPPCPNCWNGSIPFVKCSDPINITGLNSQNLGWYKPGRFYVAYCSGAWNYRDGWMVTRFPAGADQWNGGKAITVSYGPSNTVVAFTETAPAGAGYADASTAQTAVQAQNLVIEISHPGGPIELNFTDQAYGDNFGPSSPMTTPIFALYGAGYDIEDALIPLSCCGYNNGDGTWTLTLIVKNISDVPLGPLEGTLSGSLTVNNNPQTFAEIPPGGTVSYNFNVTLTSGKAITGSLAIKLSGTLWGTLTYDLTPTIVATPVSSGKDSPCGADAQRIDMNFHSNGFMFDDLTVSIRESGDVISVLDYFSCAEKPTYHAGDDFVNLDCGASTISYDLTVSSTHPSTITLVIDYMDGATILQTSSYTVPLSWT